MVWENSGAADPPFGPDVYVTPYGNASNPVNPPTAYSSPTPSVVLMQGATPLAGVSVTFAISNSWDSDFGGQYQVHFLPDGSGDTTFTGVTDANGRVLFDGGTGAGHGPQIIGDPGTNPAAACPQPGTTMAGILATVASPALMAAVTMGYTGCA